MLKYLNDTGKDKLVLSEENINVIKWYVYAYFAIKPDFKIHTGGVMTLGGGAIQSIHCKKNMNTQSSTEDDHVGTDDTFTMII